MKKTFMIILYIVIAIIVIVGIIVVLHPAFGRSPRGERLKFKLANHPWDEPIKTMDTIISSDHSFTLLRPKIGEIVYLNGSVSLAE